MQLRGKPRWSETVVRRRPRTAPPTGRGSLGDALYHFALVCGAPAGLRLTRTWSVPCGLGRALTGAFDTASERWFPIRLSVPVTNVRLTDSPPMRVSVGLSMPMAKLSTAMLNCSSRCRVVAADRGRGQPPPVRARFGAPHAATRTRQIARKAASHERRDGDRWRHRLLKLCLAISTPAVVVLPLMKETNVPRTSSP